MSNQQEIGTRIIKKLEEIRESKVIVYFTGDREPYFKTQIGEDAVRPLYDHLLKLDFETEKKRIDLFLYSLGGDVSVPWRIVSMIREFCDEFNVLIPYRAHSGATLISLGADHIIMGKKAELSPIDPTLNIFEDPNKPPITISIEDINSFLSFAKKRLDITEQNSKTQVLNLLVQDIGARMLGNVDRMNNHIRVVSEKLLITRNEKITEDQIKIIIDTLIEKMYFHGHAIGRKEAKEIGLPIEYPNQELEDIIWELYLIYEKFLKLKEIISPEILLNNKEEDNLTDIPMALIESINKLHLFKTDFNIRKKRSVPQNPIVNVNLQLQLPPQITPQQIPEHTQQVLNELLNKVIQSIPNIVNKEIKKQSPVIGNEWKIFNKKWFEIR